MPPSPDTDPSQPHLINHWRRGADTQLPSHPLPSGRRLQAEQQEPGRKSLSHRLPPPVAWPTRMKKEEAGWSKWEMVWAQAQQIGPLQMNKYIAHQLVGVYTVLISGWLLDP